MWLDKRRAQECAPLPLTDHGLRQQAERVEAREFGGVGAGNHWHHLPRGRCSRRLRGRSRTAVVLWRRRHLRLPPPLAACSPAALVARRPDFVFLRNMFTYLLKVHLHLDALLVDTVANENEHPAA